MTDRPPPAADALVWVERDGPVAIVTLNRPDALNALSRALGQALTGAFRRIADDPTVRAVVLTGQGRAFCAGADLEEASRMGIDALDQTPELDVGAALLACPWPVIAAVNGFAITGGLEIMLMCDVIYASTAARFADTHGRVGLVPGWGLSQRLSRTIGVHRAKEVSLSGNYLDAATADRWGLVNRVFEPDDLLPAARKLAHDMAGLPAAVLRDYKRLIDAGFGRTLDDGLALEAQANKAALARLTGAAIAEAEGDIHDRGRDQTRS
jgi:enoyl-CoA hydratase